MNEAYAPIYRRYAVAFLHVFGDKIDESLCEYVKKASWLLREHRNWLYFFELPDLTRAQQKKMITLLLERLQLPMFFDRLFGLLIEHKRVWLFPEVLDQLVNRYYMQHDIMHFNLHAYPMIAPEQMEEFKKFLSSVLNKNVRMHISVDERLICGIRAESLTRLWEYSIKKKLREAQQVMYEQG